MRVIIVVGTYIVNISWYYWNIIIIIIIIIIICTEKCSYTLVSGEKITYNVADRMSQNGQIMKTTSKVILIQNRHKDEEDGKVIIYS